MDDVIDIINLIAEDALTSTDAASDLFLCRLRHQGIGYAADMIADVIYHADMVYIETTSDRHYRYSVEPVTA